MKGNKMDEEEMKDMYRDAIFQIKSTMKEIIGVTETEKDPKEALARIYELAADALAD